MTQLDIKQPKTERRNSVNDQIQEEIKPNYRLSVPLTEVSQDNHNGMSGSMQPQGLPDVELMGGSENPPSEEVKDEMQSQQSSSR